MQSWMRVACVRPAVAALCCISGSVWAQANPAPQEPPPKFDKAYLTNNKNIEAGKDVWEQQCRHCHGKAAYPGKAPKLDPGKYTPDFVYDRVTYGFGKMPPWKDIFSIEQRKAVAAYVKSDDFTP